MTRSFWKRKLFLFSNARKIVCRIKSEINCNFLIWDDCNWKVILNDDDELYEPLSKQRLKRAQFSLVFSTLKSSSVFPSQTPDIKEVRLLWHNDCRISSKILFLHSQFTRHQIHRHFIHLFTNSGHYILHLRLTIHRSQSHRGFTHGNHHWCLRSLHDIRHFTLHWIKQNVQIPAHFLDHLGWNHGGFERSEHRIPSGIH